MNNNLIKKKKYTVEGFASCAKKSAIPKTIIIWIILNGLITGFFLIPNMMPLINLLSTPASLMLACVMNVIFLIVLAIQVEQIK